MLKKIKYFLLSAVAFVTTLSFVSAAETPVYTDAQLSLISQMVAKVLTQNHYRQLSLSDKVSAQVFDEYFKMLDPNKLYFTKQDLDKFEIYRNLLNNKLTAGDNQFAFLVYDVYRDRIKEYRNFAEEYLKQPFDFAAEESYAADRRNLPYAADDKELKELWRKKLKNDILYYKLLERVAEDKGKLDNSKDKDAKTAQSAPKSQWDAKTPEEKVLKRLRDINNDVMKKDKIDILGIYLNALAQTYGPHSNYLAPKNDEDFEINMKLSLSGIGATLTSDDGYIKVVSLVPGGPAALDGRLKVQDRIISITQDGGETVDIVDMPVAQAVKHIRGPENSKVTLTVLPGSKGSNAVPEKIDIVRKKVELVESEAKGEIKEIIRDGKTIKVGVIVLPSFYMDFDGAQRGDLNYRSCSRDVKRILEDFNKQKVDSVVIDLRNNGGGSLPEAIKMTGLFIKSGPVVQLRRSDKSSKVLSDDDSSIVYTGPLVILTSKMSASASEIFAAAISDFRRGLIVGDTRTFGKGTVLDVLSLERFLKYIGQNFPVGSVTYETAMFYRIMGSSVQQLGISSDIVLPSLTEQLEMGEMFLDNHLPWDSIKKTDFEYYNEKLKDKVPELKKRSDSRVKTDAEYGKLLHKIELYNKYKNKKDLSLNEDTRWKEYKEEKLVSEDTDKLLDDEENVDGKSKKDADPILDEAVNIAADMYLLP